MKIALITDTHYGARNDSIAFLDYTKKFLDEIFFPYIDKYEIRHIIHLGDLMDRRKYVNYYTANRMRLDFLDKILERDIGFTIIAGNHDTYFKDTNDVNCLSELVWGRSPLWKVHIEPTEIEIARVKILLVPWITQENRARTLKLIKKTKAQICFGHLELQGFEMNRGVIQHDGDDPRIFSHFDVVCTGHYHHRSSDGNIHYLGAPLQFSWVDYNDPRGFHIFDTETREVVFIENPLVIFKKIWYNDKNKTIDDVIYNFDATKYSGCHTKVIIEEKVSPFWFDLFIGKLEEEGVSNIQIVEDHHNLDVEPEDDIISTAEDTLTIFRNAIEQLHEDIDKNSLIHIISGLYNEALSLE